MTGDDEPAGDPAVDDERPDGVVEVDDDVAAPGATERDDDDPPDGDPAPWVWHVDRAAAALLVVLLPLALVSFAFIPGLADTTAATMTERWAQPWWRVLDWVTVVLAMVHAAAAVESRLIAHPRRGTSAAVVVVWLLALTVVVAQTWVSLTYDA